MNRKIRRSIFKTMLYSRYITYHRHRVLGLRGVKLQYPIIDIDSINYLVEHPDSFARVSIDREVLSQHKRSISNAIRKHSANRRNFKTQMKRWSERNPGKTFPHQVQYVLIIDSVSWPEYIAIFFRFNHEVESAVNELKINKIMNE